MDGLQITLTLPDPLLRAARDVAADREVSLQHLLRDALAGEVARAHRKAKSPVRADERMLAMLRARLAPDFGLALGWADLFERLHKRGVTIREAGGGLAVFSLTTGVRLCKASDMGASLGQLARRFGAPFPGDKQANRWIYCNTTTPGETDVVEGEIEF